MLQEKIIYQIYPIGLCNCYFENDFKSTPVNRIQLIRKWIPHIKDLGASTILLNPIFESIYHGYDTKDFFSIDRRLGTNESFRVLVKEIHLNNLEVVLDGVFNHVGREFFAFEDLKKNRESSKYKDWFQNVNFNNNNGFNDGFSYGNWNGHESLIKLNLQNPSVKEYLLSAVDFWINEFKIDGIRLDAADCLSTEFIEDLTCFTKDLKNDFFLISEVIHGDYNRYITDRERNSVTNYECYKGFYSSMNDKNMFEIGYSLNRQFGKGGIYENKTLFNFVDNHDVSRIATSLKSDYHLYPVHILLFTIPGIPSIYYGSEWGIEGIKDNSDKKIRPYLDINEIAKTAKNKDLCKTIKKLSEIRKNSESLKYGNYTEIHKESEILIFERQSRNEKVYVLINISNNEYILKNKLKNGNYRDILNNEDININDNQNIPIHPCWGRILKKKWYKTHTYSYSLITYFKAKNGLYSTIIGIFYSLKSFYLM